MYGKLLIPLTLLVVTFHPSVLLAEDLSQTAAPGSQTTAQPQETAGPSATPAEQLAWLGVSLENVPEVLFAQLGQIIPAGQGVLVEGVMPGSPAAAAGIRANDILLAYDDQKLYSARQVAGLVRADKPHRTVAIQVVQEGQLKTVGVTLGERAQPAVTSGHYPFWWGTPTAPQGHMPSWPPFGSRDSFANAPLAWSQFESVAVQTLPDGRYHAEVSYKDKGNNTMRFSFEGTQEEIRDQIQKNATLPEDKKEALLDALNMNPGRVFNTPPLAGDPFNDPFFREHFFGENFFRDFPPMSVSSGFAPF